MITDCEVEKRRAKRALRTVALASTLLVLGGLKAPEATQPGLIESHPFRGNGGIIILDARIGDGPTIPFILDTGANPCVIDPVTAARLGIKAGAESTGQGGAGEYKTKTTAKPVTITIGRERLQCDRTVILDLSHLADIVGVKAAGLISGAFFHGRVVRVDYDRHVLSTYRPGAYKVPAGPNVLPLKIRKNHAFVTARLSVTGGPQNAERELMVDTGSLDAVDHPLLKEGKIPLKSVQGTGVGSGFAGAAGKWAKVELGPFTFHNVDGTVPNVPIVGGGLLGRFNLTFDYDRGWLQLTPRKPK